MERGELKVVSKATGSDLTILFDKQRSDRITILDVKERLSREEGIPAEYQILRNSSGVEFDDNLKLAEIPSIDDEYMELSFNLDGGGDVYCNCTDFHPKVKILCFYCGLEGEWKNWHLCCMKCGCSIM